jgi:predicted nucleotidyltransferase
MMARSSLRDQQMRVRIAQEAARLMTEEGIHDFYAAKRKAAQHLGAPDTRNMPRNLEVEAALQEYQRLFRGDEQVVHLKALRESAVQAMRFLARFNPRLVGSVLSGTAGRHADINLHLFADTPEDISLFLMESNAGDSPIDLVVFPREGRREAPRSPVDGRPMCRAGLEEVEAMLTDS